MPSSRQIVNDFIKRGYVEPAKINDVLNDTQVSPSISNWFTFIDRLLLCLGALSLAFSVLFFIAYNWDNWGHFGKFALIESLLIATIFIYWISKKDGLKAQITLLVSCLMVGVLMAFFGQTYQTGADPWTLFFFWALLITPWVVIARFGPLWFSWLGLLNIALILYIDSFGSPLVLFLSADSNIWGALFLLNSIALIALELSSQRFTYLSPRWLARGIASLVGSMITFIVIDTITDSHDTNLLPYLFWGVFIVSLYVVYRHLRHDLFMLAGGCLSSIVVIIAVCIDNLNEDYIEVFFLLMPVLIIGLTSMATIWLKKVNKEMSS
ncbi:DUF2157 domain-containing protein [uncultured Psychromonas sp.]|uniref:DUF2157 domain-containing protein n=1 Tax=uncultured Psychromonas sp. TaxID=173974 RepID=UPI002630A89D|nr:DUF2157 domain-containing protein [uncultured Psychromonas sp.]